MIRYEHCPVCGSKAIQKVLTAEDHTVSHEHFEIWQCAHCSLRFTQNIPEIQNIGAYYKSDAYISHTETSKGIINWLYLRIRTFTLKLKRNLIEEETSMNNGSFLDVGAGTGAFVHHMQEHGWKAQGLEPDETAIQRALQQYNVVLRPASDLYNLAEKSFDAISLWHVLEHVHDLHAYIAQLKKLLKSNGKLFIAVPNYTSYDAEKYGPLWAAYDVPRHLYHFSPAAHSKARARLI